MRYLSKFIQKDLETKIVMLSGPRQVGKTFLSKHLFSSDNFVYLNWDILKHKSIIKNENWDQLKNIVVFDEIHKLKNWKNFLKGIFDQKNEQKILVTGSARLETFRKAGDALTGRYFHYRLYPYDYSELASKSKDKNTIIQKLLNTGGFPESYHHPENLERLRINRLEQIINSDLRDLSSINSVKNVEYLVELLRERVGGLINHTNLANDLSVSSPTVKNWISQLEKLYLVFTIPPYVKNLSRALKKDKKLYFYDCSMAYEESAKLENLVAVTLLKYIHFKVDTVGEKWELFYFRDKEKHEVDFVVERNKKPFWFIEVKTSKQSTTNGLYYLNSKFPDAKCFQLSLEKQIEEKRNGVHHLSFQQFCDMNIHY